MFVKLDSCPICNDKDFEIFKVCKDHVVSGESFAIVNCKKCQFKFTNPRPNNDSLEKYYLSDNYISHTNKGNNLLNMLYKFVRIFTLRQKLKLINSLHSKGNLLDFGCGTGDFLKICNNGGWTIAGVEPSVHARKNTESILPQAKIFGSIFDLEDSKKFNIITLWHVLEHVADLKATLQNLKSKLSTKGKMVIAVPNMKSYDAVFYDQFWAGYDVPRHLYHFDQSSMKKLLNGMQLKIIKIIPQQLDAFYVSLLSEQNKTNAKNYFTALKNGIKSNRLASKGKMNYSSLIYIVGNA